MSVVTTIRSINVDQLATETGWPLSLHDAGAERVVTCHQSGITNAALQTAIDAHEPAPPPPTETEVLQLQINELTDIILFGF